MQRRSDMHHGEPQLQAVYGLSALAAFARVDRHLLQRLLKANGVRVVRAGRAILVPLCEIQEKIPPLWKSICLVDKVRRAAVSEAQQGDRVKRREELVTRRDK